MAVELHGTVFICTPKAWIFVKMAVLGLYEPFTHERTFVVMTGGTAGVSVVIGVAMLSPLWGRYRNGHSVPCHEVLVQT